MKKTENLKIRESYGKVHGSKLILRSFKVDKRLWDLVARAAKESKVSISFLIRKALVFYLERK